MMMSDSVRSTPVQPGEKAPDFSLPAVHQAGNVSLSDYRGKSPVLVAIFRGLFCPFCRRAIAQMSAASEKLRQAGVEPLAVVATDVDNARLYFKLRPSKMAIVSDPDCTTHRAFGVPEPAMNDELVQALQTVRVNPNGVLPEALPIVEAGPALAKLDGYQTTTTDERDRERHMTQLKGQFLLDRDGIVRWANIECANEGLAGMGKFPTDAELLEAVKVLG
jgi:peroxiredoxin